MKRTCGWASGLVLLLLPGIAFAQAPFSSVDLQVQWSTEFNRGPALEPWHLARGAAVNVVTPFYAGDFEFGGAVHRFSQKRAHPGFAALWLYAGWGGSLKWRERVGAGGSVRIGSYRMAFDGAEDPAADINAESEFVAGLQATVSVRIAGPAWVFARLERLRVFTSPQMNLWYASGGINWRLQTGEGWADFFE